MKKFELLSKGNKVELEILEKIADNKIMVSVKTKESEITNTEASIVQIMTKPGKLFLQIETDKYLEIADRDKNNFKYIADWIWENIQDRNTEANTYIFTSHLNNY